MYSVFACVFALASASAILGALPPECPVATERGALPLETTYVVPEGSTCTILCPHIRVRGSHKELYYTIRPESLAMRATRADSWTRSPAEYDEFILDPRHAPFSVQLYSAL